MWPLCHRICIEHAEREREKDQQNPWPLAQVALSPTSRKLRSHRPQGRNKHTHTVLLMPVGRYCADRICPLMCEGRENKGKFRLTFVWSESTHTFLQVFSASPVVHSKLFKIHCETWTAVIHTFQLTGAGWRQVSRFPECRAAALRGEAACSNRRELMSPTHNVLFLVTIVTHTIAEWF